MHGLSCSWRGSWPGAPPCSASRTSVSGPRRGGGARARGAWRDPARRGEARPGSAGHHGGPGGARPLSATGLGTVLACPCGAGDGPGHGALSVGKSAGEAPVQSGLSALSSPTYCPGDSLGSLSVSRQLPPSRFCLPPPPPLAAAPGLGETVCDLYFLLSHGARTAASPVSPCSWPAAGCSTDSPALPPPSVTRGRCGVASQPPWPRCDPRPPSLQQQWARSLSPGDLSLGAGD